MTAAYTPSIGLAAALVNVVIAISALIWQLRREPRIERGAAILRILMITLGVALIVYPNVSKSAPPELVLVGGECFCRASPCLVGLLSLDQTETPDRHLGERLETPV